MATSALRRILRAVDARKLDFESARDRVHALPPETMAEVLALSLELEPQGTTAFTVLVMVLADVLYPPAFPHFRRWLFHADADGVVYPSASSFDRLAGGRFELDELWRTGADPAETLKALAAWWDAGVTGLPTEATWLEQQRNKRSAQEPPCPPSPALSAAEQHALHPRVVTLKKTFDALPEERRHTLDLEGARRVLHLTEGTPIEGLRATLERALDERPEDTRPLHRVITTLNTAAEWSKVHQAYRKPALRAAALAAQSVLYAISPATRNRLQALHFAREALEYSGVGFSGVQAELGWQLRQTQG